MRCIKVRTVFPREAGMKDREIVELFLERSEAAIREAESRYGRYCHAIALRIVGSERDAEEVVSDTWLGAWNAIPPHEPEDLGTFLGKITRQNAIKCWRRRSTARRGGETALALEELSGEIPSGGDPQTEAEAKELVQALDRFVRELPTAEKRVFLCRYWYLDPVADIAERFGYSQSKVKSMLARTRKKLKKSLIEEGLIDES